MSTRDPRDQGTSLRATLTWMAVVLVALTLAAAAMIVFLTTALHRTSAEIERSSESVRVAATAQVDLAIHPRAQSAVARNNLAGRIWRSLQAAHSYVGSPEEIATLDEADSRVEAYLDAARDPDRPEQEVAVLHAAAYAALDALVTINVAQARAAARRAERIDYIANTVGVGLGVLIVVLAGFFVYWARGPLLRPILSLADSMRTFSGGNQDTRAPIEGPRELREIGRLFNEMAAEIHQRRERQRAFLAGVAHDLRNPVNALILSARVATADKSLPADHTVRHTLERIVRQLRNMDRMIGDFLDASMAEVGSLEMRLEPRDLREPVRSTLELFAATSDDHELIVNLPDEPVPVCIDALRLEQVVANLISNAIKYSPDGGDIEVGVESLGHEVALEVRDHGLGMSPEMQARLFEPFRRGLSHSPIPGVGLGLFVTYRIVEAHGGRIEVDSEPGAGSAFRVLLPSGGAEASPG